MSVLFISDLHLDAAYPAAGRQFRGFLRGAARAVEALYILGDLFELWIGDDDPDEFRAGICSALTELTRSGTACFVMHGNRDFLLGRRFAAAAGCELLADPTLIDLGGEQVLLTHGDLLCSDDRHYQQLRANVRRPVWQRRFLRLPLATRLQLAGAARAGSQQHMRRAQPDIMDVTPATVSAAMTATGAQTLIHGHTHRPGVHHFELPGGGAAQRIVLGAWYEQGSCLRWSNGSYALESLPRGGPE